MDGQPAGGEKVHYDDEVVELSHRPQPIGLSYTLGPNVKVKLKYIACY